MDLLHLPPRRRPALRSQRGAVAVVVGVSLAALLGMFGLSIDGGRLYVNKAELQTAADACALAAGAELVCGGTCKTNHYLLNAEAAGKLAAGRNKSNLQADAPTVAVTFSKTLNSGYLSSAAADVDSRFAKCVATSSKPVKPWLMGLVGVKTDATVSATAVGGLGPGQRFCSAAPMGLCSTAPAGTNKQFGFTVGQWITSTFNSNGGPNSEDGSLTGGFKWVDFTNSNSATAVRDQLLGRNQTCDLSVGSNVQVPGVKNGVKLAYNSRFGLYGNGAGAETALTAPPDRTGYAYPNKNPGAPVITLTTGNAYEDFRARQSVNKAFTGGEYAFANPPGNVQNGGADYAAHGIEKRVVPVPVVDCSNNAATIRGMVCVLLLNPLGNGNTVDLYLEFLGAAGALAGPCASYAKYGVPGGNSDGATVPQLLQ